MLHPASLEFHVVYLGTSLVYLLKYLVCNSTGKDDVDPEKFSARRGVSIATKFLL